MTLRHFIRKHRAELDKLIQEVMPTAPGTDKERRWWVLNDEDLYTWARKEGVNL